MSENQGNLEKELFEYAVKMRKRGDTYRSVLAYLNSQTNDEQLVRDIIKALDKLEEENVIQSDHAGKPALPMTNIIAGAIFLSGGIGLFMFLWGEGFIAIIPVILIVIGLAALSGKIV